MGGGGLTLSAPFPWFGGKRLVAGIVWAHFGNVRCFTDPFWGSGALPLARQAELARLGIPWDPGDTIENANDADPYVANFWRATAQDPERVAELADWPVNEADLHARHQWLVDKGDFRERMFSDPDYYDPKVAAWWVWGISAWIGGGWCDWSRAPSTKRPVAAASNAGRGIHRKLPRTGPTAGVGVHRQKPRTHAEGGNGVHRVHPWRRRPSLSGNGVGRGVHGRTGLVEWFEQLRDRLRPVRFTCGDFERLCARSTILRESGVSALFLDPPYPQDERHDGLYAADSADVSARAHQVALKWGEHPRVRVAFCGFEGTHEFPSDWEVVAWKRPGGYGRAGRRGESNRSRERIWFSPACLKPAEQQVLWP